MKSRNKLFLGVLTFIGLFLLVMVFPDSFSKYLGWNGHEKFDLEIAFEGEGKLTPLRYSTERGAATVLRFLTEGLTRLGSTDLVPEPGAAQSWTVSPDGKLYTFELRDNLRWSTGEPVAAEDFVRFGQRELDPAHAVRYPFLLDLIAGAREFRAGKASYSAVGIRARDPKHLEIRLNHPGPQILAILAEPFAAPVYLSSKREDASDPAAQNVDPELIASNGAFKLKALKSGTASLERNDFFRNASNVKAQNVRIFSKADAGDLYANGKVQLAVLESKATLSRSGSGISPYMPNSWPWGPI